MNWLDIVIAIILIIAGFSGFRSGLISQAFGIAGLLLGIWLGWRFASLVSGWLNLSAGYANIVSFIIILIAVIIIMYLAGLFVRKVFRLTGFGILDHLGGLLLGVVKVGLILSLLLGFTAKSGIIKQETFNKSLLYKPLKSVSDKVFPWVLQTRDKLLDSSAQNKQRPSAQDANRI